MDIDIVKLINDRFDKLESKMEKKDDDFDKRLSWVEKIVYGIVGLSGISGLVGFVFSVLKVLKVF